MQVEREIFNGSLRGEDKDGKRRTGEQRVSNLPLGGGQHSERDANTA